MLPHSTPHNKLIIWRCGHPTSSTRFLLRKIIINGQAISNFKTLHPFFLLTLLLLSYEGKKTCAFFIQQAPPVFNRGRPPRRPLPPKEQEQTKFYDLRRRITEDFHRLAKFQTTLSKSTKKSPILSDLRF